MRGPRPMRGHRPRHGRGPAATATPSAGAAGAAFVNDRPRRLAMREPPAPGAPRPSYRRRLAQRGAVLAVTVGVLVVIGPFGTFADLDWGARLVYWGGLMAAGWAVFEVLGLGVARTARHGLPWRLALAGVAGLVALVLTGAVAAVEWTMRGNDFLHPWGFAELFAYVLVLTLLVSALPVGLELRARGLLGPPLPPPTGPAPTGPVPVASPFLDRLPPRLGRDLLALGMEDHYVRAYTSAGSDLVLMRMRDAVENLAAEDGLRVHRSWWVAARAVTGVERDRHGKLTLLLGNGLRVPVSRTYAAAVRAAGWA